MSDLIKSLRVGAQVPLFELRQEAADEIERLRRALEKIASPSQTENLLWWQKVAREALNPKRS